jgi:hypothetical protein
MAEHLGVTGLILQYEPGGTGDLHGNDGRKPVPLLADPDRKTRPNDRRDPE